MPLLDCIRTLHQYYTSSSNALGLVTKLGNLCWSFLGTSSVSLGKIFPDLHHYRANQFLPAFHTQFCQCAYNIGDYFSVCLSILILNSSLKIFSFVFKILLSFKQRNIPFIILSPCLTPSACLRAKLLVVSHSLRPYGLQPARLLCPWDSPGKNTGVGCHALLQRIFLTQGSNPCLLGLLQWQAGYLGASWEAPWHLVGT